jgi:hypothetical protein
MMLAEVTRVAIVTLLILAALGLTALGSRLRWLVTDLADEAAAERRDRERSRVPEHALRYAHVSSHRLPDPPRPKPG